MWTVWTATELVTAAISPCPMTTATQLIFQSKWQEKKVLYNVKPHSVNSLDMK